MSGETYAIVFKGEIVEGFAAETVKAQLAKLLKADAKKTAALFSGKQIVLKKTTDRAVAAKYGKALKKVGADVKIRVIKTDAAAAPAPAKSPAAPAFQKAKTPSFEKAAAPSFEKAAAPAFQKSDDAAAFQSADSEPAPKPAAAPAAKTAPEPEAPVDTSGITLAPNEGDLFDPVPEIASPEIDVSSISVAENDGTPLVEPSEEVVVELDSREEFER